MGQPIGNGAKPPSMPSQQPKPQSYQQPQQQPQQYQRPMQPPQQQYQAQYQPQQGYGRPMPQRGYGGGYGGGYGPPMRFGGYGQRQQPFGQMEQSFGPVSTGMSKMPDMPVDKVSSGFPQLPAGLPRDTSPQNTVQESTQMGDANQFLKPADQMQGFDPQMLQSLMGNQQLMQALQGLMRGGGMQGNSQDDNFNETQFKNARNPIYMRGI